MKLQLAIAELMQLFDDGTTQHLLGRQTGGADTGIDPVREILYYQLQRLGIVVQDARDHLQFIGQLVIGPWWGEEGVVFHVFYASSNSSNRRKSFQSSCLHQIV